MAPKGGGGGGGRGFGSKSGSRETPDPSKVPIVINGGNLGHETSRLMMCMVVVPALWYLLDDARMTEVVRWVVGKFVGARAGEGEAVKGEEGGVEGCGGDEGGGMR